MKSFFAALLVACLLMSPLLARDASAEETNATAQVIAMLGLDSSANEFPRSRLLEKVACEDFDRQHCAGLRSICMSPCSAIMDAADQDRCRSRCNDDFHACLVAKGCR